MHTFHKIHNSRKIYYWAMGNVFYIKDNEGNWEFEHKDLAKVEEYCDQPNAIKD